MSVKAYNVLLPCELSVRLRKLESLAAYLDVVSNFLQEVPDWANVEIEGGFAE